MFLENTFKDLTIWFLLTEQTSIKLFSGGAKFKSLVLRGKSGGTRYTIPVSALPIVRLYGSAGPILMWPLNIGT